MFSACSNRGSLVVMLLLLLFCSQAATFGADPQPAADHGPDGAHLFNGRDLSGWVVYTAQTKFENPGVFQVIDGMIYAAGGAGEVGYYGGLITRDSYENYRLRFEYKWGQATYPYRKGKARDAGVLIHAVGPHGPGPWMTSYEFQVMEGCVGEFLAVEVGRDDSGQPVKLEYTAEIERKDGLCYFKPGAALTTIKDRQRLNWWGRDPQWKDEAGFRGHQDVESPLGQWTRCEIVADGDAVEYFVNGTLVNRVKGLSLTKGRILFQTEGAEVWYRNIELSPLK